MYSIAIYDDNPLSIQSTREILEKYYERKKIKIELHTFEKEAELISYLSGHPLSLIFLDIELEDGKKGIDVAKKVNELQPDCQIAYLTNYLTYARDIFETNHCYYIMKDELEERLDRLTDKLLQYTQQQIPHRICMETKTAKYFCNTKDILYVERNLRNSIAVCTEGKYEGKASLDEIEKELKTLPFVRCHTSLIVNLDQVKEWRKNTFVMNNGDVVNISRKYKPLVTEKYMEWV